MQIIAMTLNALYQPQHRCSSLHRHASSENFAYPLKLCTIFNLLSIKISTIKNKINSKCKFWWCNMCNHQPPLSMRQKVGGYIIIMIKYFIICSFSTARQVIARKSNQYIMYIIMHCNHQFTKRDILFNETYWTITSLHF